MALFPDSTPQTAIPARPPRRSVKRTNREATLGPSKLLLSDTSRIGLTVRNTSSGSLFLDIDSRVSAEDHMVEIASGGYYEMPFDSTLEVWGLWEDLNGKALIREFIST